MYLDLGHKFDRHSCLLQVRQFKQVGLFWKYISANTLNLSAFKESSRNICNGELAVLNISEFFKNDQLLRVPELIELQDGNNNMTFTCYEKKRDLLIFGCLCCYGNRKTQDPRSISCSRVDMVTKANEQNNIQNQKSFYADY